MTTERSSLCQDDQRPVGKFHTYWGQTRRNISSTWKHRSCLEKLLIVTCFLMIFVVIVIFCVLISEDSKRIKKIFLGDQTNHSICLTPACITLASSILNSINYSMDPCEDFYEFACGGWISENDIPDGLSFWGTFKKLWLENEQVLKVILERSSNESEGEALKKAQRYYQSCMDTKQIEKLGAEPVLDVVEDLGGWSISDEDLDLSDWNLEEALDKLHNTYNVDGMFSWTVGVDDKNSTRHIIKLDQGGLTLPSADYYKKKDKYRKVHLAFQKYMDKVGMLLNGKQDETGKQMKAIFKFEARLAEITMPESERRDTERIYNLLTIKDLHALAPSFNWTKFFRSAFGKTNISIKEEEPVVVYGLSYIRRLSDVIKEYRATEEKKVILQNYLVWRAVTTFVSYLPKSFRDAYTHFHTALFGHSTANSTHSHSHSHSHCHCHMCSRRSWKVCVADTNKVLGFTLGAAFIDKVFHGENKIKAEEMLHEIRSAFRRNLPTLEWLDPETRKLAVSKVEAMTDMIGFPESIMDTKKVDRIYKRLEIKADEYFLNYLRIQDRRLHKNLRKLRKPVSKVSWSMTPPQVNAYYTLPGNTITFPVGILQAPFYDSHYPKALNFGGLGVVMGHELTHAFDDRGREYDKYGNLHHWWKNKTLSKFTSHTDCMVQQYSQYQYKGEHINGKQTLGENLADNGGLKMAYLAYEDWVERHGEDLLLPGLNLTNKQLLFTRFAQVWCTSSTEGTEKYQILNSAHPPSRFRITGTVSNSHEFSKAFGCAVGTKMNPRKKCNIWK